MSITYQQMIAPISWDVLNVPDSDVAALKASLKDHKWFDHTGYSDGIYRHDTLAENARAVVKQMSLLDFDFVAVTGKSGMAVAFAALMLRDFNLVTVRKHGEKSHGNQLEGRAPKMARYIVIDDMVSSGKTLNAIDAALARGACSEGYEKPTLVGVVCYNKGINGASHVAGADVPVIHTRSWN